MRIGVVSEGPADFAVLRNIVKGALGLDASDVDSIRPELQSDETDLNAPNARSFSNWRLVREECERWTVIETYASVSDDRIVITHVDTAECELEGFDVARPPRERDDYVMACRVAVLDVARSWPARGAFGRLVFAIAVEETDAWLLPLYGSNLDADTGTIVDPKKRLLERELPRTNELTESDRRRILRTKSEFEKYHALSAPLRKTKALSNAMACNASLESFVRELIACAEAIQPGIARLR